MSRTAEQRERNTLNKARWYAANPGRAARTRAEWCAARPGSCTKTRLKWREDHPGRDAVIQAIHRVGRRIRAFTVLGGKCVACGIDDPRVLEFNHKNGDGKKHRTEIGGEAKLVSWVINNPKDADEKLELLCANCHAKVHSTFNMVEGYMEPLKRRR